VYRQTVRYYDSVECLGKIKYCVAERIICTVTSVDLNVCVEGMITRRQKTEVEPLAETSWFMLV
jgi:hypothetical protein